MSQATTKAVWRPHPGKQEDCLAFEDVNEKLYGGGRGGGKTDVGQVWMVHPDYVAHPLYRGLVIRKRATDLTDWMDRAKRMYAPLRAQFKGSPGIITFPSGAVIRGGHLGDTDAYTKYQGHEYQRILIEEASHIPSEDLYEKLLGSNRSTIPELPARSMCTANPDGDGNKWLKKRFRIKPSQNIQWHRRDDGRVMMYVPSKVEDNPTLAADPAYIQFLEGISDPDLRRAWREGDWEAFGVKGSYFGDLLTQAKREGRVTRVPWEKGLKVYTWWDLGMNDATVILFFQFVGREIRLIDMYEMNGQDLAHYAKVLSERPYSYEAHYFPHDGKVSEMGTGKSRKEVMQGLVSAPVLIVPNLPIQDGIDAARMIFNRLWINEALCQRFVDGAEIYRREWVEELQTWRDKPVHDWASHIMDAFRYMAVSPEHGGAMAGHSPPPTRDNIHAAL